MNSRQSSGFTYDVPFCAVGSETRKLLRTTAFPNTLASHWPSFVDCSKRLVTEAPFLDQILTLPSEGPVLDACTGIGCESIYLRKRGFNVISNEVDSALRSRASESAQRQGTQLSFVTVDWREIGNAFPSGYFQAIVLLGNSLGLLMDKAEIASTLIQMHKLLKPGGLLIVDQRNYDYILSERDQILQGNFRYSRKYIYCGSRVTGRPIEITDKEVMFGYFTQSGTLVGTLSMLPIRKLDFSVLLHHAGFSLIQQYFDFRTDPDSGYDFLTLVATRAAT